MASSSSGTLRIIYLHGLASSPGSHKATRFDEALRERGHQPTIPDLNRDDFRGLTISRQLAQLEQLTDGAPDHSVLLIGSSLGGYTSALFAAEHRCMLAQVLMAPAFDFHARWSARVGATELERWRELGEMPMHHFGTGKLERIGYGLMEDAASHTAYPACRVPTLTIHGNQDQTVAPEVSLEYARRAAAAGRPIELELIDADHTLGDAIDWVIDRAMRFIDAQISGPSWSDATVEPV